MERSRIELLNISPNLVKALHNMGVEFVEEVAQFEKPELESLFNIKGEAAENLIQSVRSYSILQKQKEAASNSPPPDPFKRDDPSSILTYPEKLLMETALFKEFPIEIIRGLAAKFKTKSFSPSEAIIKEGEKGDSLYILRNGMVEVRKRDIQTGIEFSLTQLSPPASFGEMSLITGKPRSASVIALDSTDVYVLHASDFKNLMMGHPQFSIALAETLAKRIEELNEQKGVSFINLSKFNYDTRILKLIPKAVMQQNKIIPLAVAGSSLTLAMVNPNDLMAFDDIRRFVKGLLIDPVVVTEKDFDKFMKTVYEKNVEAEEVEKKTDATGAEVKQETPKEISKDTTLEMTAMEDLKSEIEVTGEDFVEDTSVRELTSAAGEAPVIRLANTILGLAIKNGVSDIHIEPREKELVVRNRQDGMMHVAHVLPKKIQLPLISRFKILANMDIAEKRVPQDGRISVRQEGKNIDFRVNSIPCKFGEKICMRLLDKSNTTLGIDKLVTRQEQLDLVREMIQQPYGIIFVTGPTGSGKTTTLYSALAELNTTDTNICTAEDPIEYDLNGINQVQIVHKIGLTFASVLRAFLRQDPDIMLVGETRDSETAKVSIEAALTGHLVFTTLHTNDAPGSVTRLREMGVEPFLIGSSTIGIMAQRLARKLCQKCKEPYQPDETTLKYLSADISQGIPTFFKGKGCEACKGSGFKGRVGIYEVMRLNEPIRRLIASDSSEDKIRDAAIANGMKTLMMYGIELLKEGQTTVEELLRVVAV